MDKLKIIKELLESHRNGLSHQIVDPEVDMNVETMLDALFEEIERLSKALENIRIHAYKTEEDADYEVLNKAVATIWEMCEQALIEG